MNTPQKCLISIVWVLKYDNFNTVEYKLLCGVNNDISAFIESIIPLFNIICFCFGFRFFGSHPAVLSNHSCLCSGTTSGAIDSEGSMQVKCLISTIEGAKYPSYLNINLMGLLQYGNEPK